MIVNIFPLRHKTSTLCTAIAAAEEPLASSGGGTGNWCSHVIAVSDSSHQDKSSKHPGGSLNMAFANPSAPAAEGGAAAEQLGIMLEGPLPRAEGEYLQAIQEWRNSASRVQELFGELRLAGGQVSWPSRCHTAYPAIWRPGRLTNLWTVLLQGCVRRESACLQVQEMPQAEQAGGAKMDSLSASQLAADLQQSFKEEVKKVFESVAGNKDL